MKTNIYALKDGTEKFIINPDNEANPVKAKEDKKNYLVGLNLNDLHMNPWTAEAIRNLAKGIVRVTDENGKRLKKNDLIKAIQDYVQEEKAVKLQHLNATLEVFDEYSAFNKDDFFKLISKYKNLNLINHELSEAVNLQSGNNSENKVVLFNNDGIKLVDDLTSLINIASDNPKTRIKTYLPEVIKIVNSELDASISSVVAKILYGKYKADSKLINSEYKINIAKSNKDQKLIKWDDVYDFAMNYSDPAGDDWKGLSHSLAIFTGRRMCEVHSKDTKFSLVGKEDRLLFEGQAKTKRRGDVPPYEIVVFANPELVLNLWLRLKELGKGDYDVSEVNRKLSKALSSELPGHIKNRRYQAGITKYKDIRDIYAANVLHNKPGDNNSSNSAYLAEFLGHHEDDIQTVSSYQKFKII